MKNYVLVIFGLLLLLSGCGEKKFINNINPEIEEVENFIVEYYKVMSSRNWLEYQEFFSDKAILTTIWQDSAGAKKQIYTNSISDFVAQTADGPDSQPIFEENPIDMDVKIKNNLASVWVKYEAKFGSEHNLIEWTGYDLISLLKFNNKWYITSITYVSDE